MLNPKYFTTFAAQSGQSACRHIKKAFALFEDLFNLPHLNFSYSENIAKRSRFIRGLSVNIGYERCGSLNKPIAVVHVFCVYICEDIENDTLKTGVILPTKA